MISDAGHPKGVLFDLDGTLVDSDPIHIAVFIDFLDAFGITLTEADYAARFHGRHNVDIFRDILPDADPHEMDRAKEAAYRDRIGGVLQPISGVGEVVRALRSVGCKTAVVSNAPRANVDAVLSEIGMTGDFDFTVSSDEVARGKPDPEIYLSALDALGLAACDALTFEDSPSGIRAAVAAGIKTVGVTSTLSRDDLLTAGVADTIADFNDAALGRHLTLPEGALT